LRGITFGQADTTISSAFSSWISADCGGGEFPAINLGKNTVPITCHDPEYNQTSANANVWMFHDEFWPYDDPYSTIALTTVTYNTENGEIYDADVEVNSFRTEITAGDANVQFDLLSIATHEAGHFLGLSHSLVPDATMLFSYRYGDTALRSIGTDDIAGICAVYPPGRVGSGKSCTPRHGFSAECASEQDPGGCTCTLGRRAGGSTSGLGAALVGLFALARTARRRVRDANRIAPPRSV
jgi:hypothetical protein